LPGLGQYELQRSDALVLEDIVIVKEAVKGKTGLQNREAYLAQFQLD
jgi:hypothetical protein